METLLSWMRVHRKAARIGCTAVAVAATSLLLIYAGASLAASSPPQLRLLPDPMTPTPSATPQTSPPLPVVEATVPASWLIALIIIAVVAGLLRFAITDKNLASGEISVVTGRRDRESALEQGLSGLTEPDDQKALGEHLRKLRAQRTATAIASGPDAVRQILATKDVESAAPRASRWPWRQARLAAAPDASHAAIMLAARAIAAPASVFTRVNESRMLEDEHAQVTLTRTIDGTATLRNLILVPVLRVPKGELVGSMTVTVDGKAGRTLPMIAGRGVVLQALSHLADAVVADGLARRDNIDECIEDAASLIVADVRPAASERRALLDWLDDATTGGRGPRPLIARQHTLLTWIRSLVDIATATDIVFAIVPDGCTTTHKVAVTYDEPYGKAISPARRFVGIGRSDFSVDLRRAAEADTFHLDIRTGSSTYFEEAAVVFADESDLPDDAELVHVAPLRGDAHAHVYIRSFGDWVRRHSVRTPIPETPKLHIRMRERPPGLIGPTFALSLWICGLTWTIAYFYPVLFPAVSGTSSAWTTLVLAAPALLTGWLLSRLNAEAMRYMSASAFVLIIWLSLDVAAVVTASALTLSGAALPPWPLATGVIELHHPEWVALMLLTLAHVCASGILFLGRGLRYSRTIREGLPQ